MQTARYKQFVATSSLAATLSEASAQNDKRNFSQVHGDLIERLKAHLALTPGAIDEVGKLLAASLGRSTSFDLYISVLSFNGSEAAQTVLQEVITARQADWNTVSAVITSLSRVANPSDATVQFLTGLATDKNGNPDVRNASFLALSSVGHTLNTLDPDAAKTVYNTIVDAYDKAATDTQRNLSITAMGNMGREEQLGKLSPLLSQDQPAATRALAVHALRFVGGDKADDTEALIVRIMTTDPDEKVRASAANALNFHGVTPAALVALGNELKSDRSAVVLQQVLSDIASVAGSNPGALTALKKFANSCGSHDVCKFADQLVLSVGSGHK
jgi:hypothetical protein